MNKKYNVGIFGASGMVGQKIIEVLLERQFPIAELFLYTSSRSAGKSVLIDGVSHVYLDAGLMIDPSLDIAFMAAGGDTSALLIPQLLSMNVLVIDNSSHFRMDEGVPLMVPEVNPIHLEKGMLVSNPNCSTIQSVIVLNALKSLSQLVSVDYTTYQAVSGSGVGGVRDLTEGTTDVYPYSIKSNVLPHIDVFLDSGYTKEEMKMVLETQKIMNDSSLAVSATCARVPIVNTHAISMILEFSDEVSVMDVRGALSGAPGVLLVDDVSKLEYPLAESADGQDLVLVGRVRQDLNSNKKIHLWCVADNIRKGAASNTVQIAELFIKEDQDESKI